MSKSNTSKAKPKDKTMAKYGSAGYNALRKRLGSAENVRKHFARLSAKRWRKSRG